jgi:hypothetical protein
VEVLLVTLNRGLKLGMPTSVGWRSFSVLFLFVNLNHRDKLMAC